MKIHVSHYNLAGLNNSHQKEKQSTGASWMLGAFPCTREHWRAVSMGPGVALPGPKMSSSSPLCCCTCSPQNTAKGSSSKNGCLAYTTANTPLTCTTRQHLHRPYTPHHSTYTAHTHHTTAPTPPTCTTYTLLFYFLLFLSLGWVWRGKAGCTPLRVSRASRHSRCGAVRVLNVAGEAFAGTCVSKRSCCGALRSFNVAGKSFAGSVRVETLSLTRRESFQCRRQILCGDRCAHTPQQRHRASTARRLHRPPQHLHRSQTPGHLHRAHAPTPLTYTRTHTLRTYTTATTPHRYSTAPTPHHVHHGTYTAHIHHGTYTAPRPQHLEHGQIRVPC